MAPGTPAPNGGYIYINNLNNSSCWNDTFLPRGISLGTNGYVYEPSTCGVLYNLPEVELNIEHCEITAKARKLKAVWTIDAVWNSLLPKTSKPCIVSIIRKRLSQWKVQRI